MAEARTPGPQSVPTDAGVIPARTPGSLGVNDAGDPNVTTKLGNTPGSVGVNDAGDPTLRVGLPNGALAGTPIRLPDGGAVSVGMKDAGVVAAKDAGVDVKLKIKGVVATGGDLSQATIVAVNTAAERTPPQFHHYIAYDGKVKVVVRSPGAPTTQAIFAMPRLRLAWFLERLGTSRSLLLWTKVAPRRRPFIWASTEI